MLLPRREVLVSPRPAVVHRDASAVSSASGCRPLAVLSEARFDSAGVASASAPPEAAWRRSAARLSDPHRAAAWVRRELQVAPPSGAACVRVAPRQGAAA